MGRQAKEIEDFDAWQESLMEGYFKYMKVIFLYPILAFILAKTFIGMVLGTGIHDATKNIVVSYIIIACSLIFNIVETRSWKYKTIGYFIVIEMMNSVCFILKIYGGVANSNYYIILSCFISFIFGFFLFTSRYLGFILQIKTIYFWLFLDTNQHMSNSYMNYLVIGMLVYFTIGCTYVRNKTLRTVFNYKQKINRNFELMQVILDTLPDGMFVMNSDGEAFLMNEALKQMLNITNKTDLEAQLAKTKYVHDRRFYHVGDEERSLYDDIQHYFQSDNTESLTFGITQIAKNYYEWRGSNFKINNLKSAIFLVRDSTNIILLEKARAIQKFHTAIIRSVSHELRTPISAIISANEIIASRLDSTVNEVKDPIEVIKVSAGLLMTVINDLIDLIQIIAGSLKLNKSYFDIRSVINNTVSYFEMQAHEKGLILKSRVDREVPAVVFNDPDRLHQVLINILSNALKFTFHGEIGLYAKLKGENIKISVKDTGIGISDDRLSNLSDLLESVDLQKDTHSCGLGLHITFRLAKELGGKKLKVKSKLNQYSKFTFFVNAGVLNSALDDSTDENIIPITLPKIRKINSRDRERELPYVLIVDDNDFNRLILTEFLRKENILFEEAINGSQAVEAVRKRNRHDDGYKLIVMDCQMPIMDGWEATINIHKMSYFGELLSIPAIVAYTAYYGAEEEKKSLEVGMLEFLRKPVTRERFLNVVRKYII